jgi:tellurium resistance protein TerD
MKGQRIDLTKGKPGLKKVKLGLGWETNKYQGNKDFDLDASAFLLNKSDRVSPDTNFVFYGNSNSSDGSVVHSGDNLTGGTGSSIDEEIIVDFTKISDDVEKISFTVTIHEADERGQNFGQVSNAFVSLFDEETNEEIMKYKLDEDFSIQTSVVFCEVYRDGSDWKFRAVGQGYTGGLADLCKRYGLSV